MRAFLLTATVALAADMEARPVQLVINKLKTMQAELQKEADSDEKTYDAWNCWAKSTDAHLNSEITTETDNIARLSSFLGEAAGRLAALKAKSEKAKKDLVADQEALAEAQELRNKENSEFNEENKDSLKAASALKGAISALKKHQSLSQTSLVAVAQTLGDVSVKYNKLFSQEQMKTLQGFIQAPAYNSASGGVFGILENMLDTFQANVADAQAEEDSAEGNFIKLKEAKQETQSSLKETSITADKEIGELNSKHSQAVEDLGNSQKTLADAEKQLAELKASQSTFQADWDHRTSTRADEQKAVAEALNILDSDDSRDQFGKVYNKPEMFLQLEAHRARVVAILRSGSGSKALALMATKAQAQTGKNVFNKVRQGMVDMAASIKKQKADDVQTRDYCIKELHANRKEITVTTDNHDSLVAKSKQLGLELEQTVEEIERVKKNRAQLVVDIKRRGEERSNENVEFHTIVADQQAAVGIIGKAKAKLMGFYAKKEKSLMQGRALPGQPGGFKKFGKNKKAGGVLGMIDEILNDTNKAIAEARKAENDSQKAYEEYVQDSNDTLTQNDKSLASLAGREGGLKAEKSETDSEEESVAGSLEDLEKASRAIHTECDFYVDNFDARQGAQQDEIESLQLAVNTVDSVERTIQKKLDEQQAKLEGTVAEFVQRPSFLQRK